MEKFVKKHPFVPWNLLIKPRTDLFLTSCGFNKDHTMVCSGLNQQCTATSSDFHTEQISTCSVF